MEQLSISAGRLIGGGPAGLGAPTELAVTSTLDSPAVSLRAKIPCREHPGELWRVEAYYGDTFLFSGEVDEQRWSFSQRGFLLELEARSREALLLDNEALPCTLTNVRIPTIHKLFVEPHGFTLYNPQPAASLAVYTVAKGTSAWEALTGFTRRAWGITPYVAEGQVMVDTPRSHTPVVIGSGGGLPLCGLTHTLSRCKVVSEVVLRDDQGNYSVSVRNPSADYQRVERRRYVIPGNEFVDDLRMDANQRIRRSMLAREETIADLPGLWDVRVGQEAELRDGVFTLYNLLVTGRQYLVDSGGLITRLTLQSSVYYR